jgi:type IV pilus assembly protein PilM
MAANTTTLYISDVNMCLMITRGKRIIKLADMPLDTSLNEIDSPEKETQLVEKIKHLFKSNRISARKIILGISGLHCLTRPLTLPELPKAMLAEAITREARRVLPVPVEQLYISWQTIAIGDGKLQAFMVAIPRHVADTVLKIVDQAGFKPYLMDIKPMALARLAGDPNSVIVDVQPSEFDIIVLVNGIPQPIRTVPFAKESPSLKDRLVLVRDELERTIQFFNENNTEAKIQPGSTLLVSGEIADETDLLEALEKALNLKVAPLVSPLKCLKQLDPSHHLVNVGLALKESLKEPGSLKPNFNTLPMPYLPKQISFNKMAALPAVGLAVGMLIMLGMTIRDATGNLDEKKIEISSNNLLYEKKVTQKKEMTNTIADLQAKLSALDTQREGYAAALKTLTSAGDKMNADLNTTFNNVVSNLDLYAMSFAGSGVSVTGRAGSEQAVMQYVRKLASTGRYQELTITSLTAVVDTSQNDTLAMDYSLTLKLKGATK